MTHTHTHTHTFFAAEREAHARFSALYVVCFRLPLASRRVRLSIEPRSATAYIVEKGARVFWPAISLHDCSMALQAHVLCTALVASCMHVASS